MSTNSILQAEVRGEIKANDQKELKRCPFCAEVILTEAKKCKYCQEILDPELKTSAVSRLKWSPATAAALSLLVPGGGQIYRGKFISGCLWAFFVAI